MLAAAMLDDDADKVARKPVSLIETRKGIRYRAFDLAALERYFGFVAAAVPGHDPKLIAKHLLHHDRHVDAVAADTGAAQDELLGLRLLERLHRRLVPHIAHIGVAGRIADPGKARHVEIRGAGIHEWPRKD